MEKSYWTAPKSIAKISSWHVQLVGLHYIAGHFALTGHGDALDARFNVLPTGRTKGRALRAFRRALQRSPILFGAKAEGNA